METENSKAENMQIPGSEVAGNSCESVSGLPCNLSIDLPVAGFKVRDLLELEIETVVDTRCNTSNPVPIWVNAIKIGDAEFDLFGTRIAIRINELR